MEIYGTFGPACTSLPVLTEMFQAGMCGLRLNLSHRSLAESRDWLELAQKAKFSPHALTEEELMQFDVHNRSCLRRLRNQNPLRRLIHQYIYAIY